MTSSGSLASAKAREAAQVAEHDHDLAPVALQERLVARSRHEVGELRRKEAAQPADPLQLRRPARARAAPARGSTSASSAACRSIGVVVALDPQRGTRRAQQLALVERLGQEVVGAGLDRALDLLLVAAGGDHHDRQEGRRGRLADPPAHLVAVDAGHHDVEQDEVGARVGSIASASSPEAAVTTSYPRGVRTASSRRRCSAAGRRPPGSVARVSSVMVAAVLRKSRTCCWQLAHADRLLHVAVEAGAAVTGRGPRSSRSRDRHDGTSPIRGSSGSSAAPRTRRCRAAAGP